MLSSFELKTYKQLEFTLGAVNVVLLAAFLLLGYCCVLTPAHRDVINVTLDKVSSVKLVALLPIGVLALLWAWLATQILRLHDRLHEPIIRKWRAGYDADFVL